MASSQVSSLTLGNYLKIVSKGAVYNNLSEDSPIWDLIKKKKKGPAEGRELRFLLRSAYGSAAAGFVPVTGGTYPTAQQATISEGTTQYKDFALTVEVERTLIAKAMSDFSKYGEPLAEELRAKTIALSRILSGSVYGDGTGVIAQSLNTGAVLEAGTNDRVTFNVDPATTARGFIGWVELGDKLVPKNADGTAAAPTVASGTFNHYVVISKDRTANTVTLEARDSSGTVLNVTGTGLTAGDVLYRATQSTFPDLTAISSSTEHNTLSETWAGLAALTFANGNKVNGITMSGALGGTRKDCSAQPIDSQDFQQLMSQVMIAVGQGRYKYNKAMMAWETLDALIESRETDRRFTSIQDNKRGVASLGYVHGKNTLMFEADEFCPKSRIYVIPEADILQFHGSDFEFVKPEGGQKFFLKPNSTGHDRVIRAYMEGDGALMSVHSAGIGVLENFTV